MYWIARRIGEPEWMVWALTNKPKIPENWEIKGPYKNIVEAMWETGNAARVRTAARWEAIERRKEMGR